MIGSLRGVLLDRSGGEVLVEVGGVGYRVTVTPATAAALGPAGGAVFLHVHHHVREDAQTLFGFCTSSERQCFEALIGAHGVGPSLALAILSVHAPAQLHAAIAADDVAALCLVPGVGKKTATRLLVELKSRLDLPDVVDLAALDSHRIDGGGPPSALGDVREALANLGYQPDEVRAVLAQLHTDGRDAATLVREALKLLAVRV